MCKHERTYHEQTSANTSVRTPKPKVFCDLDQTAGGAFSWETLGLVDLAQHGISGLGNESSSETGNETRTKVNGGLEPIGSGLFVHSLVDGFGNLLVDDELGHGVWDPLTISTRLHNRAMRLTA